MSEKTLSNIRIINKHDTEANWLKATGFTPKQGELIVYDIDSNHEYERVKIGDGVQNVNDLPFVQDAEHTHDDATTTTSGFMSAVDKNKLDTYINDSGSNTKFIGKNNSAVLNGGTINISAEQNLNGVRIYNSNKTVSGSFFIHPNEQGNPISISHEKTYLSLNQEYTNNDVLVRGIATPESDNDAANKTYVDTSVSAVSALIGDTAVSEQIEAAQIVYVGPDRPTDPNIKVWINTAEEGTGVVHVLPRIASITLVESAWTGSKEPYSQSVEIATVTTASKIDLQPTAQQIVDLQNAEISLMVENNGGVVTCYAIGNKPTVDYTMQVLIQEVSYV